MLLVPPGQKRRRPDTWPDLYRLLSSGEARGVINVVSSGYHSTEAEYQHHEIYDPDLTHKEYLDAYLDYNRQREIAALEQIAPHLKAAKGKTWMITLVTKQDLWWRERQAVEKHYKEGKYEDLIEAIVREKGREGFVHNYFSVSLVPRNLRTRDEEVLALTTAGYDEPLRLANLKDFLEGLNELLNSE